jgi:hypothetical protein
MFINENIVVHILKVFKNLVIILYELRFWNEFDPLNDDVDVPPLEQYIIPFFLLYHIKYETDI